MIDCDRCQNVIKYDSDIVGSKYRRILFVLHMADRRVLQETLFDKPLFGTRTGRVITELLNVADIDLDEIIISNFYKCLGRPGKKEYLNCVNVFEDQFKRLLPKKMVLFGAPAYKYITGDQDFEGNIGKTIDYNGISTYVSHHPSKIGSFLHKEKPDILKHIAKYLRESL